MKPQTYKQIDFLDLQILEKLIVVVFMCKNKQTNTEENITIDTVQEKCCAIY